LPESPSQLVPKFLPEVPVDPFTTNHTPLRYRVDASGPTLWSVGQNQTDEGGMVRFNSSGDKATRWDNQRAEATPDIVFGAGWTHAVPPFPPVTRPVFVPGLLPPPSV